MNKRNFIRRIENFTCEVCGEEVKGNGYTDHCPKCLWGKHVDKKTPGDRTSSCGGLMRPGSTVYEKGKWRIYYECQNCDHKFRVWADKNDDKETLMKLMVKYLDCEEKAKKSN